MDIKFQAFLTLCRLMNYRKTADALHLTQPAVTKQIQSLEQTYNTKLFIYDGRKLHKTPACDALEKHCESLQYIYGKIEADLKPDHARLMRLGATKTIGDYVLGPRIISYLRSQQGELSLVVDNTEKLMSLIDNAELDFAVIEGFFDKKKYGHHLVQKEPFVGICQKGHPFANKTIRLEDAMKETLIVRESGSGTRDILEHELKSMGYDLKGFAKSVCISSFKLIRELIAANIGISFMYQSVIKDDASFATFQIEGFHTLYEFNAVYLKNTNAEAYANAFLSLNA